MIANTTEHRTLLGICRPENRLVNTDNSMNGKFTPLSCEMTDKGCRLRLTDSDLYVSGINPDLTVQLGKQPVDLECEDNGPFSISFRVQGLYVSARTDGSCNLQGHNKEWEQFTSDSAFVRSILKNY